MKTYMISGSITLFVLLVSCNDMDRQDNSQGLITNGSLESEVIDPNLLRISRTLTDKNLYSIGEAVKLRSFDITNQSDDDISIDSIYVNIGVTNKVSDVTISRLIGADFNLEAGRKVTIPESEIIQVNDKLNNTGYLVHVKLILSRKDKTQQVKQTEQGYITFFRVAESKENLTYKIASKDYQNLPVFSLKGGLSAEYTVQKSAASLAGGISHSWNVPGPGMGPQPLLSTPDFLERSIAETVDFYNENFGANTTFETVIISTGIPSGAYLARAMNAPALPIHFLMGVHTTKEVQTVLDYSKEHDIKTYATIGHDYSLSNTKSVAWIKLLSLPTRYKQFLIDHNVSNIIFHGALGRGGESKARKLIDKNDHYGPGSIYLMHFAGDQSEKYLGETIRDFDTEKLEPSTFIADWEAGVIDQQVDNIGGQIRNQTSINDIVFVTTNDAIHLWNMGAYMMLSLLRKNNLELKGVSLNPYLIAHPVFETYNGYIPFLYWQGFEPQFHIDSRFNKIIKEAIHHYYPAANINDLTFWVNSTNNFGGTEQGTKMVQTLKDNGYGNVRYNHFSVSETWNLSDGINSACEKRAEQLVDTGAEVLHRWNNELDFLSIQDLENIAQHFSDVLVIIK